MKRPNTQHSIAHATSHSRLPEHNKPFYCPATPSAGSAQYPCSSGRPLYIYRSADIAFCCLVTCYMYVRCSTLSSASARVTREGRGASLLLLFQQATLQVDSEEGTLHVRPDTRPLYRLLASHNQHLFSQTTRHMAVCQQHTFNVVRISNRRVFHVPIQIKLQQ
jgi:hypothetical protein